MDKKEKKKSRFKRKSISKIIIKKKKKVIRSKRKDQLKTANLIERTIKIKKPTSCHIVKKKTNNSGRQNKLTPKIKKILLNATRMGMQLNRAFKLAGISSQTYYNWLESGRYEADRIRKELSIQRKLAIDNGELNPWKVQENENWIDNKINELCPNKYFDFLICIEKENAMMEMDNLNSIHQARDGGEYLAETIVETDENGKLVNKKEVTKFIRPNWKAAKFLLSKTLPDIYADKQILAHEGELKQTHEHDVEHTITLDESPDRVAEVLGILIQSGVIERKLIEDSKREPKLITDG